jgi:hypothetical protein
VLADQGDAEAQFNLGVMYRFGRSVPEDDAEAVKWYRLAADQGAASAQYNLGLMYVYGRGVPEDDAEAVKWYRLAADQGHPPAWLVLHRYDKQSKEPDASTDFIQWRLRQLEKESNDPNASFLSNGWNSFIAGFCKVEFVCYAGDPNWLGWVVLGFGLIVIARIISLFNS